MSKPKQPRRSVASLRADMEGAQRLIEDITKAVNPAGKETVLDAIARMHFDFSEARRKLIDAQSALEAASSNTMAAERDEALQHARVREALLGQIAALFSTVNWEYGRQKSTPAAHAELPTLVGALKGERDLLERSNRSLETERDRLRSIVDETRLLLDTPGYRAQRTLVDQIDRALANSQSVVSAVDTAWRRS